MNWKVKTLVFELISVVTLIILIIVEKQFNMTDDMFVSFVVYDFGVSVLIAVLLWVFWVTKSKDY